LASIAARRPQSHSRYSNATALLLGHIYYMRGLPLDIRMPLIIERIDNLFYIAEFH